MRSKRKEDNKEKKGKGKSKLAKKDKVKNTKDGTNNKAATKKKTDGKADKADKSATGQRKRKPKTTEDKPDKPSKTRRSKKSRVTETEVNLSEKVIQQNEIAEWVWGNNIDYSVDLTSFKKLVRSALTKFTFFRHNIYWTTFKCGLTMFNDEGKKDVATIYFSDDQRGLATAIACCEFIAARTCKWIAQCVFMDSTSEFVFWLVVDLWTSKRSRSTKPGGFPHLRFSHVSSLFDMSIVYAWLPTKVLTSNLVL